MGLLNGKVCLVTGSAKGIGLAIVKRFAEEGAKVYANIRSSNSVSIELERLSSFHQNIVISPFDVTQPDQIKEVLLGIKKQEGKLDVLVNNAAEVSYELLPLINFEKLDSMINTNVVAVIRLIQLSSRIMSKNKQGSIINISSIVGVKGVKGQLAYAATKGAVNAITLSAAKELAEFNVRVNALAPGMVATERLKTIMDEKFSDRLNDIGFGRMALPEEIADSCVYLASDLSKYVTGQIIGVDGSTII